MKIWQAFTGLFLVLCGSVGAWSVVAGEPRFVVVAVIAFIVCSWLSYYLLMPIEAVSKTLESLVSGDLQQEDVTFGASFAETGRLINATNRLTAQLRELVDSAEDLAAGNIQVARVEGAVLRSKRLSDGDVQVRKSASSLERSFAGMTNQMRRLAIQARVIARDDLQDEILNEKIPGEVGDAFSQMVHNLRGLNRRAERIAQGDLTTLEESNTQGELNRSFQQMTNRLVDLVSRITDTALHISAATEQMSAVLREQEFAASHQASSVEETQRTMETLLLSAKKIAESAQSVFKSAEKTQANNRTVADRIGELKAHTERIAEILDVIRSIADRSDLLALNASLEGMRAGEAGKGFTLVAAEMRRLAENITGSVGDINELLVDVRESALSSVMATEEGTNLSERTTDSALKITLITQQQQSGTEQVTQSMEELSALINQGVSGTTQLTGASSELVELAEGLRALVEQFRVGGATLTKAEAEKPAKIRRAATVQIPKRIKEDTPIALGSSSGRDPTTVEFSTMDTEDKFGYRKSRSVDDHIDALEEELNDDEV